MATAASTALPPLRRISAPTDEAIGLDETTMPCVPRTGSRDLGWAFRAIKSRHDNRHG